jgi:hypothetical protein
VCEVGMVCIVLTINYFDDGTYNNTDNDNDDNSLNKLINEYQEIMDEIIQQSRNSNIIKDIEKIIKYIKPNIYNWIFEYQTHYINIKQTNLENSDLSKYSLNLKCIFNFLEKHNLTNKTTYEIKII